MSSCSPCRSMYFRGTPATMAEIAICNAPTAFAQLASGAGKDSVESFIENSIPVMVPSPQKNSVRWRTLWRCTRYAATWIRSGLAYCLSTSATFLNRHSSSYRAALLGKPPHLPMSRWAQLAHGRAMARALGRPPGQYLLASRPNGRTGARATPSRPR